MTAEGVEPVSLNELLRRSDFASIHAPHNAETHHLLTCREHFALMKPSAVLINCGRGGTGRRGGPRGRGPAGGPQIAAAGLDVLEQEPPDPANPLLTMDNVLLTPHVASATSRMRPTARRRAVLGRSPSCSRVAGRWPPSTRPSSRGRRSSVGSRIRWTAAPAADARMSVPAAAVRRHPPRSRSARAASPTGTRRSRSRCTRRRRAGHCCRSGSRAGDSAPSR